MRILIAEDEPEVAAIIETKIRPSMPATLISYAGSIAQAIGALTLGRYDLVISDFHFQDGHGDEIFAHLKATQSESGFVMFTGSDHRSEHYRIVHKPDFDALVSEVVAFVSARD